MRAEVTADNTSIRVSWQWSRQGLPMCVDLVRVDYQPEGGSLMVYTVDNTTVTSATLSNLQCDTKYTIRVNARGGQTDRTSVSRMVSLPARGMYMYMFCVTFHTVDCSLANCTTYHSSPSHSYWSYCSVHECLKCQDNMAVD